MSGVQNAAIAPTARRLARDKYDGLSAIFVREIRRKWGQSRIELGAALLIGETSKTSLSSFAFMRDFRLDDATLNEATRDIPALIFAIEDEQMIAAQQNRIGDADFSSSKSALLGIDNDAGEAPDERSDWYREYSRGSSNRLISIHINRDPFVMVN